MTWFTRQFDPNFVQCAARDCRSVFRYDNIKTCRKCPKCKLDNKLCRSRVDEIIPKESLSSSLDRASKNVQSWPQWKQQAAGADLYSSTKDEYNKEGER